MFDPLTAIFPTSFYFVAFTFIPVTIILKIITLLKTKLPFKTALLILFTPFSISYFYYIPKINKVRSVYRTFIIIYAVFAFLAFAFAIHVFF